MTPGPPPPPLRAGDRVVVVSPAGPCPVGLLDAGTALLRAWGLDVRLGRHALDVHPALPYLAGTDADRAADFQDAWCDPSVAGVLCARGGYGSGRMVDLVDWRAVAAAGPKVFLGSSDTTVLHERLGVPAWFGPMVGTGAFVHDVTARERLRRALFEGVSGWHGTPVAAGAARGVTAGGNVSLLGTPPPAGSVALLEDVDEEPYRLDRMLTGLLRSGWFAGVTGIALGSWARCGDVTGVLADRLGGLGVPIVGDLGFGHCPGQHTVPLGVEVELDGTTGTLTVVA